MRYAARRAVPGCLIPDAQERDRLTHLRPLRAHHTQLVASRCRRDGYRGRVSRRLGHGGSLDKRRRSRGSEPHRVRGVAAAPYGKCRRPTGRSAACREHVILYRHDTARQRLPIFVFDSRIQREGVLRYWPHGIGHHDRRIDRAVRRIHAHLVDRRVRPQNGQIVLLAVVFAVDGVGDVRVDIEHAIVLGDVGAPLVVVQTVGRSRGVGGIPLT